MKTFIAAILAVAFVLPVHAGVFIPDQYNCPGDKTTSSSSANLAVPFGLPEALLSPSTDTYIHFGQGNTTTATIGANLNILLKAGAIYVIGIPSNSNLYLAYVSASSGSTNVCFGSGE